MVSVAKRGRPRKPIPENVVPQMQELYSLTQEIKQLQDNVVRLSRRRKDLIVRVRDAGTSTGAIAEACGLDRRSYPIRNKKND